MASPVTRRPLPALVSLLALLLLTGLVWWRVLHRSDSSGASKPCPTQTTNAATTLPAPSTVTVQVLNSTKRAGIAARARTTLVEDGFLVPRPALNDRWFHLTGVGEIRYGPTGAKGAKLLSFYFPGAKLVPNTTKTATVVVSLGAKYKRVAAPSTVAAALKSAGLTVADATPAPSSSPSC